MVNDISVYSSIYIAAAIVVALYYAGTPGKREPLSSQEYVTVMLSIFLPIVNAGIAALILLHHWAEMAAGVKRLFKKD